MKTIYWSIAVLLFSAAAPALAVNNSLEGGTGLVVMRTADTLPRGALDISTFSWGQAVRDTRNNLDWDALVMPQLSYGLFSFLELGVGAPYQTNVDSSASGMPRVNAHVKVRFFNPAGAGISAAVTAYGGFLSSSHVDVASGDNNYGAELNISMPRLLKPLGSFHASLGLEKSDTRLADATYRREIKRRLNLGMEVPLGKKWNASMEVMLARAENVDDTVTLVPGLRYMPSERLTWLLAASWGTPKGIARPEVRVVGGVSYAFGAGPSAAGAKPSRPAPGGGDAASPATPQ